MTLLLSGVILFLCWELREDGRELTKLSRRYSELLDRYNSAMTQLRTVQGSVSHPYLDIFGPMEAEEL